MPTVLLILPSATYRAAEFLAAASAVGAEVVIASDRPPVFDGGARFLQLDLENPERSAAAIVELDTTHPLDAVVGVDDLGLLTAAIASAELGLAANPVGAVASTRNKVEMRRLLDAGEVRQPAFETIERLGDDAEAPALAAAARLGYPVVIKPSNQAASRGVIRADDASTLEEAMLRICQMLEADGDTASPLLVERYVDGDEISIEGLLTDGHLATLAVFDKPDPLVGPFFEETIFVTPSRHAAATLVAAAEVAEQACAALGLVTGPIHAELRLEHEDAEIRPVLLEVAARTIGGRCAHALAFSKGRSLEAIVLEHALALEHAAEIHRSFGAAGVMMLPIPHSGTLIGVHGRADALAVAGITGLEISVAPGKHIDALPEGNRYLGFLFAKAATPADVEAALRDAHGRLQVEIARDDVAARIA